MKTQFVTDTEGNKKAILLPIKEYERMLEEIEELKDIKLYDEIKLHNEPRIPFDEYLRKRKKGRNA